MRYSFPQSLPQETDNVHPRGYSGLLSPVDEAWELLVVCARGRSTWSGMLVMMRMRHAWATLWCISLGGALFAPISLAQLHNRVTVEQGTQRITLSVEHLTPLNEVLAEVCMQTRAICEGIQQTDSMIVPEQHFSGSWYEVISHLFEGAGLNYVVIAPSVSSGRTLKILGMASDSESGRQNASATASPAPNSNRQLVAAELSHDGSQASATPGDTRDVRASTIETAQNSGEAANNDFSPSTGSASITSSSPESGPGYLLFPDGNGNPIPTAERKTDFLAFPDSRGNPIPVSISRPPLYLLFPNSHGQPIPVSLSGQPPQYLLFPDSGGNPIPVQQPVQP